MLQKPKPPSKTVASTTAHREDRLAEMKGLSLEKESSHGDCAARSDARI